MRARLAQLHQSGATVGQVPVWDGTTWGPDSGGSLPWFVVTDLAYGATGDGTTDDTTAINAAIAALNTAGAGVLYFPVGNYKVTAALTTITAKALIKGDGSGNAYGDGASRITCTSATVYCLTIDHAGTIVEDLCLVNSHGTETAGAGIRVTTGERTQYRNVSIYGFYDNMTVENGGVWEAHSCWFTKPVRYSLYVRNIAAPDGGDSVLSGCNFYSYLRNASAAIRQESGGGLKMVGCKINENSGTGSYNYGIDLSIASGISTGVLLVSGCSIEGTIISGIRGVVASGGLFSAVVISGTELGTGVSGSTGAIDLSTSGTGVFANVVLSGLTFYASPSRSVAAVVLTNVNNVVVGDRVIDGFTTGYSNSGGTGVVDGMAGAASLALDDLTDVATAGETTDDVLTYNGSGWVPSSIAERVRDTIGTALVAGTGMTVTVDDPGNTITLASSSAGELLMQDGTSSPPVPLELEAGTDWLYQG